MEISIVIPTFNEEKYLPRLLESIKNQSLQPIEVFVCDHNSTDKTKEIVKKLGAIIMSGGMPSKSRNTGGRAAKGDLIYFLDSDTELPKDFLKNTHDEFVKRHLGCATADQHPAYQRWEKGYGSRLYRFYDKIMYFFSNKGTRFFGMFYPVGMGVCIVAKKTVFEVINGFDEEIVVFEDNNFLLRASKVEKFGVFNSDSIGASTRRFDRLGRFWFPIKIGLQGTIGRLLFGESKDKDYFNK